MLPFVQKVEKLNQQVIGCNLYNPRQQRLTEEAVVGERLGRCSQEENFNSEFQFYKVITTPTVLLKLPVSVQMCCQNKVGNSANHRKC